jgi:FkbM family methyltransferase
MRQARQKQMPDNWIMKLPWGEVIKFTIKYFLRIYFGIIVERNYHLSGKPWSLSFKDLWRIEFTPRFTESYINLLGKEIKLIDSASFHFLWDELFVKEIYKFGSQKENPYIIDCGANIGLSLIYFKTLYPNAEVIAFEPDKKIFKVLCYNIKAFQFNNVQLFDKAVWSSATTLFFAADGSDGGRISNNLDDETRQKIQTVRLREYLWKEVDFLKIDIEGAEVEVLKDCADLLNNVENLFVEYHSFVGKKQELDILLDLLTQAKFRYYISHVGIVSRHPLEAIASISQIDNQLNIYAYRE